MDNGNLNGKKYYRANYIKCTNTLLSIFYLRNLFCFFLLLALLFKCIIIYCSTASDYLIYFLNTVYIVCVYKTDANEHINLNTILGLPNGYNVCFFSFRLVRFMSSNKN